jgi:hypothetical protein
MQIQTSHNTLKFHRQSLEQLAEDEDKFPPKSPHPKEELNTIMYQAGQRSIVEWINIRVNEDELS